MLITAAEIIKNSAKLYQKNWKLFLKYMLLLFIPTGIIAVASGIMGSFFETIAVYGFSLPMIIFILIALGGTIASIWITIAFVRVIFKLYNEQISGNIKEELQKSTHLIWISLLVSILTSLIILGGLILLIIPGVLFAVWFAFSFYAVAIDEHKVVESLKTSHQLVKNRWWAVLWRLIAPGIFFALILMSIQWIISLPFSIAMSFFTPQSLAFNLAGIFFTLVNTLIGLLFTPLSSSAPTILYSELKKNTA